MNVSIRPMTICDYEAVYSLWLATEGIFLADADDRSTLSRYLTRNPSTSLVGLHDDRIVSAVLCGHDGRRATFHHLAVLPEYRNQGIGRLIVQRCLDALAVEEISTSYIFVGDDNPMAQKIWKQIGWEECQNFTAFRTVSSGKGDQ